MDIGDNFVYVYLAVNNCHTWTRFVVMSFCIFRLILNLMLFIAIRIKPTLLIQLCLQQLMLPALICHITTFVIWSLLSIAWIIVSLAVKVEVGLIVGIQVVIFALQGLYSLCFVRSYYETLKEDILPTNIPPDVQQIISELRGSLESIQITEPTQ